MRQSLTQLISHLINEIYIQATTLKKMH